MGLCSGRLSFYPDGSLSAVFPVIQRFLLTTTAIPLCRSGRVVNVSLVTPQPEGRRRIVIRSRRRHRPPIPGRPASALDNSTVLKARDYRHIIDLPAAVYGMRDEQGATLGLVLLHPVSRRLTI